MTKPLKVLHILSSPAAGGAEVFVKDLVLNSLQDGIKASVLFIGDANQVGREQEYQKQFLLELKQHNIRYAILPKGAKRNPLKGRTMFRQFIRVEKPDCIHSHLLAGIVYAKLFQRTTPLIYTHHSSKINTNPWLFKLLMRQCQAHIGISKTCAEFFDKLLPPNKPCHLIYNALDSKRLRLRENPKIAENEIQLLAVGSLREPKNYPLLLEAVNQLLVRHTTPNFKLSIAGEGCAALKESMLIYIKEHHLTKYVVLLGNRSDIPELLYNSDVFVMSSAWEGLPISLLEAQFSGVTSVVTDVGGCKEVLNLTQGGIVVPPRNIDALANALHSVISSTELRSTYSRQAISSAYLFSIMQCIKKHKAVYQLISNKISNGNS